MLCLNRLEGQEIYIDGGRIRIKVLGVSRTGQVRLGVDAGRDVRVDRKEIHWRRIQGFHSPDSRKEISGNA